MSDPTPASVIADAIEMVQQIQLVANRLVPDDKRPALTGPLFILSGKLQWLKDNIGGVPCKSASTGS